jgi:hypothetical protein
LGALFLKQGRHSEAEAFLLRSFASLQKQAGAPPGDLAAVGRSMVRLCVKMGRDADAGEWRRKVLAVLKDNADLEPKAAPIRQAVENARRKPDAQVAELPAELWKLFNLFMGEQRYEAAEKPGREALALWEKARPDDWNRFRAQAGLGRGLLHQERHSEAEPLLVAGCEGMLRHRAEIPPELSGVPVHGIEALIDLYLDTGRPEHAAEWRRKLVELKTAN